MKRIWTTLAVLAIAAASCGRTPVSPKVSYPPPSYQTPTFGARESTFTDDQVRAAVYTAYLWPADFYHESGYALGPYYLNEGVIKPVDSRPAGNWRELATDDIAQARAWAESTLAQGSNAYSLADGPATNRYFEFSVSGPSGLPSPALRVHRLSYLDPLFFRPAYFYPDSLVGTFNARPVDTVSVRGLAEYLWYTWFRDVGGYKVLSSFGGVDETVAVHVIYDVEASYGDFNVTDDLRVYRLEFRVAKGTGEIVVRRILQRHVVGTRN